MGSDEMPCFVIVVTVEHTILLSPERRSLVVLSNSLGRPLVIIPLFTPAGKLNPNTPAFAPDNRTGATEVVCWTSLRLPPRLQIHQHLTFAPSTSHTQTPNSSLLSKLEFPDRVCLSAARIHLAPTTTIFVVKMDINNLASKPSKCRV